MGMTSVDVTGINLDWEDVQSTLPSILSRGGTWEGWCPVFLSIIDGYIIIFQQEIRKTLYLSPAGNRVQQYDMYNDILQNNIVHKRTSQWVHLEHVTLVLLDTVRGGSEHGMNVSV